MTDIDFNPYTPGVRHDLVRDLYGGLYARIAELDAVGNLLSSGIASGMLGSYDALSLAYNPVTGTFGLVGLDRRNDNVLGLELNARGYPFNGENTIGLVPRTRPGRYTRVASSTTSPTWNSTFSIGFGSTWQPDREVRLRAVAGLREASTRRGHLRPLPRRVPGRHRQHVRARRRSQAGSA